MKNRFRQCCWCNHCKKEIPTTFEPCQDCGANFAGEWGFDTTFSHVVEEKWISEPIVWWKPSTWSGGRWEKV